MNKKYVLVTKLYDEIGYYVQTGLYSNSSPYVVPRGYSLTVEVDLDGNVVVFFTQPLSVAWGKVALDYQGRK